MREIKNTVIEMKHAFDGLISRLDRTEKRISELKDISIETSKLKSKEKKDWKKTHNRLSKNCGTITNCLAQA